LRIPRREIDVEEKIRDVLIKFVNQKFNGITIADVVRQYDIENRRADIAVLKDDGKPILIIETKKKYEKKGYRSEFFFIPTSEHVVGQAVTYAALLKVYKGIHVPFVATANDAQLVLFTVPENIEDLVNWNAIEEREYNRVVREFYKFRRQNIVFHKPHGFSEEFFRDLLDTITGIYAKKYKVDEKKQELHWILIEDFRSFIELITPFVQEAIAPNNKFRDDIARALKDYIKKVGYIPSPKGLAREMAYVLLNKIVFYKVLERYYNTPRLEPFYEKGTAQTCNMYLSKLRELFDKAVEVSKDFEAIFKTGIYDAIDLVESEEVLNALDWLIRLIDNYEIERLGDIVGFIYEELIPPEERHLLGQFYTPRPIAELIVKWCIRSPDDKILDPGCGSGTFLVEAYKRLAELKLKRSFKDIKHVSEDVHRQILRQLYGIDINEFPAHLTAMNLAMKNVRAPSTEMNIFVRDYFTVRSGFKLLAPYKVKTLEGEKEADIVLMDFDAVVGNPPYTRWGQLSREVQNHIITTIGNILKRYDLLPQAGRRGAEYNMFVFWITHSIDFLKEGGRLGMIVSDSWLQTAYGVRFGRLLAEHFKIHAIIDISVRVFPVPLIGSCIVLLERCSDENERNNNTTAFVYLNVKKGSIDIAEILKLVELKQHINVSTDNYDVSVKVYRQSELIGSNKLWIQFLFNVDDIMSQLGALEEKVLTKLGNYFEPTYGNTLYTVLYTKRVVRTRHAGVGGEKFFYLTEDRARQYNIPQEFLASLIPSSRYLNFFSFTREDWNKIREEDAECYLFLCHRPKNELPSHVLEYVQLGETEIKLTKGIRRGEPVCRARAAEERRRLRQFFFDWYDLGGVIEAPIYVARGSQYWMRFVLAKHQCALDDRVLALIPKQGVQFSEIELKALLAYLNSSFTQLQAEVRGRSTGGGMLELDVRPLSELLILDAKKLPRETVERLAQLFDKLEAEARKLGGADTAESIFGSELAKVLTRKKDVKANVIGLYSTTIKEIDYEIARILEMEHLIKVIRALVLELIRRRLSRASEAKREAIKGSEEVPEIEKPKKRAKQSKVKEIIRKLTEFFEES